MLALAGLCFFANFYISFGYGSLDGLISEWKQPPDQKTLYPLRQETIRQLTFIQDDLAALTGLTLYEKTFSDMCAKGKHDWKRSDSFAYTCMYRLTYYYGTNRDYKELLLDLEKKLKAGGWVTSLRTSTTPTITDIVAKSSDEPYLVELPDFFLKPTKQPQGEYVILSINSFKSLDPNWTKMIREPSPFRIGLGIGQVFYEDSYVNNPEATVRKILDSGQQPVMFAVSKAYFAN